jgi:two-component sensor histidine kinase
VLTVFQESQRRINSIALVHETLYQTGDLARVNLAQYIRTLSAQLMEAHGMDARRIVLHLEVGAVTLPLDVAVPCGLILNELLSNGFKHAFPGEQAGDIIVTLTQVVDVVSLMVKDTGCGFLEHFDFRDTESLGLQLICALTEQLQGHHYAAAKRGNDLYVELQTSRYLGGAHAEAYSRVLRTTKGPG